MSNEADYPATYQLEDGSGSYLLEDSSGVLIKELQNYYELVRVDGAVSFWPLSEASSASPAADLIGGNNGTYVGSPTMAQTGPLVGDTSTSILVNGSTQDVTVAGSAAYTAENGALTIEAWVTPTSGNVWEFMSATLSATSSAGILTVNGLLANTSSAALFNQNGGTLAHKVRYASGWVHIAMTVDVSTTTARMYVNSDNSASGLGGDFPTVTAFTGTPKTWNSSSGANIAGSSTFFAGNLALFAIYPTALTADQIALHYRCGLQFLPDIPPPVMLGAH